MALFLGELSREQMQLNSIPILKRLPSSCPQLLSMIPLPYLYGLKKHPTELCYKSHLVQWHLLPGMCE